MTEKQLTLIIADAMGAGEALEGMRVRLSPKGYDHERGKQMLLCMKFAKKILNRKPKG